jgi:serine protease Do
MKLSKLRPFVTVFLSVILIAFFGSILLVEGPASISASHAKVVTGERRKAPVQSPFPDFTALVDQLKDAVVNIRTTKKVKGAGGRHRFYGSPFGKEDPFKDFFERFFGDQMPKEFEQKSLGSGFIIDESGYILTNNHVVEDADEIIVKLSDKEEFDAKVIGLDKSTDIALIKIDTKSPLPVFSLGDSDRLKIGEWVLAIGNPFGLEHTVTAGIISAKGRWIGSGPYDNFLQTDASINPGNSGGPLFNLRGEVVGINTAIIARGSGIGFAIPINMAKELLPQLKEKGKVTRGWLGVSIQPWQPGMAGKFGLDTERGALIGDVMDGDPADKAGIRPGDVIVEVDGENIKESRDLLNVIARKRPGTRAEVKVMRAGEELTLLVTLGERPSELHARVFEQSIDEELGLTAQEITPELAERFGLSDTKGVIVSSVESGSQAEKAGLRQGDVIREVERKKIDNLKDYREAMKGFKKEGVLLWVQRGKRSFYMVLKSK